jgi:hypothetical protein
MDIIPEVAIDYVRAVFAMANDKVSQTQSVHPAMPEPTLDNILVMALNAEPPAFFAQEQVGVLLESHWLGGRWMYHRWEIADIAFFVMLRRGGHLIARKVALLQTKRLYSREIPAVPASQADYEIGIGRLVDRIEPTVPLSRPRAFGFDHTSAYVATHAGHDQIRRIDEYAELRGIPVYYGFYNPVTLPFTATVPMPNGVFTTPANEIGCRVLPAAHVHPVLDALPHHRAPTVSDLTATTPFDPGDPRSTLGWRLERFVADEVLRCREGALFEDRTDENLQALLYSRSAPLQAAITITIDVEAAD